MSISFRIMVFMLLAAAAVAVTPPVKATNPRRLQDTTPTTTNPAGSGSPNDEIKCGSCPCGTTCYSSPPPPSPSPPPPSPPPPKKPSPTPGLNCPPPPSGGGGGGGGHAPPGYIYVNGPPGDLYPVVQSFSAAGRRFTVAPPLLMLIGLLGMLACW